MSWTRRSGRIAKELPIVVMGTDTLGKVFAEQTTTVVLSRHGAGIASRNRFAPDEVLTLRLPGTSKEAEIRLVGLIGGEPGRYIYGVAFVNPDLEFWEMEFPPPEPFERPAEQIQFACSLCDNRQKFAQREIEEDVYSVNEFVLRFCQECGTTTRWKKAEAAPLKASASTPVPATASDLVRATATEASLEPISALRAASPETSSTALLVASPPTEHLAPLSDLRGATAESKPSAKASIPAPPAGKPAETPGPALDANGRRINRRRHVRVKVNFSACVRHPAYDDEIVECQNVSKGGLCFQSRRQYSLDSMIEVAAPYEKGQDALFTQARILRVEPLRGTELFRYGVAYMK